MGYDLFSQFTVKRLLSVTLYGYDVSFTNAALWGLIAVLGSAALVAALFTASDRFSYRYILGEKLYNFISSIVHGTVGSVGDQHFPFIFTLFVFVWGLNIVALIPGSFSMTSHIIVTVSIAILTILWVTMSGIYHNGFGFLRVFFPEGYGALLVLLAPIEILSYLIRIVSLSVRLCVNIFVGHIILELFAEMVISTGLLLGSFFFLLMPIFFVIEVGVACLQAYVFIIMTCMYLDSVVHIH